MADITPITDQTSATSGSDALQGIKDAVTNLNNDKVEASDLASYVAKATYDANTILYATTNDTPVALTVGASTIVGRKSSGDIVALTATETRTIINVADGATANSKATGAEVDTGTDDTKFLTVKAVNDSNNIPWVAPGTSGNVMKSNGTSWTSGAASTLTFRSGTATRAGNTSSGTQTIAHGLGASPVQVKLHATWSKTRTNEGNIAAISMGVYDSTGQRCTFQRNSGTAGGAGDYVNSSGLSTTQAIAIYSALAAGTEGSQVAVVSVDATNITLTWTYTAGGNLNANDMNIVWEACA